MSYVTVVTPTYNRASNLPQAYHCLINQTFKDFEWLIIDDGSTDHTEDVVNGFIHDGKLTIRYYKKENGGKHTALNFSYQYVNTDYLVILDSDDEFTNTALEVFHDTWESIDHKDRYWCISARCVDSQNGRMIGKPYCQGINDLVGLAKKKEIAKAVGEKCTFRKTKVLAENPFPEYPTTKFVSEDMIWSKIHKMFDQYCINDIVRIYHTERNDGLSKGNMHSNQKYFTYYYLSRYIVNEDFQRIRYDKTAWQYILHLSRCAMEAGIPYNEVMGDTDRWYMKILITLGYPISWLWVKVFKKIARGY